MPASVSSTYNPRSTKTLNTIKIITELRKFNINTKKLNISIIYVYTYVARGRTNGKEAGSWTREEHLNKTIAMRCNQYYSYRRTTRWTRPDQTRQCWTTPHHTGLHGTRPNNTPEPQHRIPLIYILCYSRDDSVCWTYND
ncbi:hypothetical protein KGM_202845 [Danaus plexippus plexippus]|uniref:Uncharacterized protein n=1 Tax=Danaus plexippus plexippus TaxID=278856 RepID=A0A212EX41_DANPL|nr:hypothetical protein KGM_202845 [Danaus plexippus plexippus]